MNRVTLVVQWGLLYGAFVLVYLSVKRLLPFRRHRRRGMDELPEWHLEELRRLGVRL